MIDENQRARIRHRAADRCEYCHLPQAALPFSKFHVDHIVAIQHGGTDSDANLALCCSRCNFSKGPNLSGIDPITGDLVALFNPRTQSWHDHFEWQGVKIAGITPTGRATERVLAMNEYRRLQLRRSLNELGQP